MRLQTMTAALLAALVALGLVASGNLFASSDEGAYVIKVRGMT